MGLNPNRIIIGNPNQEKTTGAIADAPLGSAVPTFASQATKDWLKANGYTTSGYCDSDGLSMSTEYNTNGITEWGGATVRKLLESFEGELSWAEMEVTYEAFCHAYGAENVISTPPTAAHGERITVKIGNHLPPARTWVFRMKDGDDHVLVVVPNGQVTNVDEITFNVTDAIKLPLTLSCYDDGSGNSIYVMYEDGTVLTGSTGDDGSGDGSGGSEGGEITDDDIDNLIPDDPEGD